jgi:hypothetical protein
MGGYQEQNVLGGQILYPLVGDDWRRDPALEAVVADAVATTDHLYWSIHLGGQAVLGGTDEALAAATASCLRDDRRAHVPAAPSAPLRHSTRRS